MLHKKRADYFFLILTVFSILFMSNLISIGHAEAAVEIGKFSKVEGKVDVLKDGELPAIPANAGDKVFLKNVIRTKSNSKAEILFSDGNILKIDQRSRVDISEYVSEDAKGKRVIKLPRGKVEATVMPKLAEQIQASPKAHSFEIHTPNAVAGVRGTKYRVLHIGNITWVFVFEGTVNVYNPKFPDAVQVVNAGFMIMIPANDPAQPPRPLDPALLGLDLNSLPPGTPQDDTVVVVDVAPDYIYIPLPVIGGVPFDGIIYCAYAECEDFAYYDDAWRGDPFYDGGLYWNGNIDGVFAGTDLWANPASFRASGTQNNTNNDATLFGVNFEGSASDNTAFLGGLMGRVLPAAQLDGRMIGLYIKPDRTVGILFSDDMTGSYGTSTWNTSGTLNTVDMGTTIYTPDDLYFGSPVMMDHNSMPGSVENLWDEAPSGTASSEIHFLQDQGWGIITGDMGNVYNGAPPANWDMSVSFNYYDCSECPLLSTEQLEVTGTTGPNNTLTGKFLGYGANIDPIDPEPEVGIFVGEVLGTFNPAAETWQAIYMGYVFKVDTFLSMVQTAAGQAALQKLHIPSVEIGRANLSGSYANGSTVDINMDNVIFFASSTGTAPAIWATGNVNGTYSNDPQGVTVPLSGDGLNADFFIENWDTSSNRWLATINGSGNLQTRGPGNTLPATHTGSIDFKGAGAGTFTGTTSGSLSGKAAGIAKPIY